MKRGQKQMIKHHKTSSPGPSRLTLAIAAALAALPLLCSTSKASDHIDSPNLAQDRGSDIADMWAFLDPNDNSKVVLIASTQGFIVSGEHFGMVIFDSNIRYRFEIENTGDATPDLFLDVKYTPGVGRLTTQNATITLHTSSDPTAPGAQTFVNFQAPTTKASQAPNSIYQIEPAITTDGPSGTKFFGGAADDPFFLDDTGANRFVADSLKNPGNPDKGLLGLRRGRDTYAGFNTLITAVSVPASLLRGTVPVVGVNFVTQRRVNQVNAGGAVTGNGRFVTVDRQGGPLVNNGLIPASRKNEYNNAKTEDDVAGRFVADLTTDLQNFGTDAAH
ncbi:MAG: DUF4331 family protein, partial [Chthoniobacterales bacterium]